LLRFANGAPSRAIKPWDVGGDRPFIAECLPELALNAYYGKQTGSDVRRGDSALGRCAPMANPPGSRAVPSPDVTTGQ